MRAVLLFVMLTAEADPTIIDKTGLPESPLVFADGLGHFIIAYDYGPLFYGDGVTFYETRTQDHSMLIYKTLIDPRFQHITGVAHQAIRAVASVNPESSVLSVTCGEAKRDFQRVPDAASLLERAVLKRSLQDADPEVLAFDKKHTTTYYVDRGRFPDNASTYRLFVGPEHAVKQLTVKTVDRDKGQTRLVTAKGILVFDETNIDAVEWRTGKRVEKLIGAPISNNQGVIFTTLGVYDRMRFGSPCDDLITR